MSEAKAKLCNSYNTLQLFYASLKIVRVLSEGKEGLCPRYRSPIGFHPNPHSPLGRRSDTLLSIILLLNIQKLIYTCTVGVVPSTSSVRFPFHQGSI